MEDQSLTAELPTKNAALDGSQDGVLNSSGCAPSRYSDTIVKPLGSSPLDRRFVATVFPDERAQTLRRVKISLRAVASSIGKRRAATKAALPWLKLADMGDVPTSKGSYRHNANVRAINGIEADYDSEQMTLGDAEARLLKAGISALLCTTASHRPEAPRWRVFCPTSRPLDPHERAGLVARLNGVMEGQLAPESFTLSQAYYYGGVEGQPAPEVALVDGPPIDLADDLERSALDKRGRPWGATPPMLESVPDDDGLRSDPDVERIRAALDSIPPDAIESYWPWLRIGMALHSEFNGDSEGLELWDEASQFTSSYDAAQLSAKWESFGQQSGKAIGIGSLFEMAKAHGWSGKAGEPARETPAGSIRRFTPADCENAPARGYIIKGILAPRDVACIFGPPGGGKSALAPYLGYMLALGEPAFGKKTKPGIVHYVAPEDDHGMARRIAALRRRHGDAENFIRLAPDVGGWGDLFAKGSPHLKELRAIVAEDRPALIVIDTLAMAFALDENDAQQMDRVVRIARKLTEHGAAVVILHHDPKHSEGAKTPRGSSVLNGALDMAIHVSKGEDGIVRGRFTKNRNGAADLDLAFRVVGELIGVDEDGDPETAALLEEVSSAAPRTPKLSHAQREALAILNELSVDGDVDETVWRDTYIDGRRVSQADERTNRKTAFNNVRRKLYERGLIVLGEVRLWPFQRGMLTRSRTRRSSA